MKILKTIIENIERYKDNKIEIDFFAEKKVSLDQVEERVVSKINNNNYMLNSLSFLGINASGKTTTIKLISQMIDIFVGNKSLDFNSDFKNYFKKSVTCTNYLYDGKKLYKIVSIITKDILNRALVFEDEFLYEKKISASTSKKNFFDFEEFHLVNERSKENSQYLKEEDSIFSSILNKIEEKNKIIVRDMTDNTNFNYLSMYSNHIPKSFINFLDSSIESFREVSKGEDSSLEPSFEIKFKNDSNFIKSTLFDLEKYLSSGTIKGLSIFMNALVILGNGGYLIIDEIENHLNKTIVIKIIELFNSSINKHSATLVFSTHYSEIIDTIERSDSIYVLDKRDKMQVNKFSKLFSEIDRKDKKKSDIILSGIKRTVPEYSAYKKLRKDVIEWIEG